MRHGRKRIIKPDGSLASGCASCLKYSREYYHNKIKPNTMNAKRARKYNMRKAFFNNDPERCHKHGDKHPCAECARKQKAGKL